MLSWAGADCTNRADVANASRDTHNPVNSLFGIGSLLLVAKHVVFWHKTIDLGDQKSKPSAKKSKKSGPTIPSS
jgi:hypothetical protein